MRSLTVLACTASVLFPMAAQAQWETWDTTDPITDQRMAGARIRTGEPSSEGYLAFQCREAAPEVVYKSSGVVVFSASDVNASVIFRFDADSPATATHNTSYPLRWSLSTDRQAVFSPSPLGFAERAKEAERVVLRVYDHAGTPHTDTFLLAGFLDASAHLDCFAKDLERRLAWESVEPMRKVPVCRSYGERAGLKERELGQHILACLKSHIPPEDWNPD